MHATVAPDTNVAATPCPSGLARQDAADIVTPARVTKGSKKRRWWRGLLRCFGCFSKRDDTEGDTYTPHTPPPPSPTPPGPQPELPATEEASPFHGLPAPPLPANEEDCTLPPAIPSPFPGTDEEFQPPAPSPLLFPVTEEADAPTPVPGDDSGTVQPAEGKKNRRRRQRRRAKRADPKQATPSPGPTAAPANTPATSPALAPAPPQAEEREAAEDLQDLVQLRRGQTLTYSRAVYVEGQDATDGDGWTAPRDRKARGRGPLQQEPPVAALTDVTSTEAAVDGGGWIESRNKWVRGRRPLQHQSPGKAPPAASITAAARQPSRMQQAARQPSRMQQAARNSVRASWQEPRVEYTLPVLPHLRRRIVGRGGAFLRDLRKEFPAVRVRVPPPQDTTSRCVAIEGPRAQANVVLARLRARLQEAAAPTPYAGR